MKRSIHYKNILKTAVTAALCAVIILGTAACGNGSAKAELRHMFGIRKLPQET